MNKAILVSLITVLALLVTPLVLATDVKLTIDSVELDGMDLIAGDNVTVEAGELVPLRIGFTAKEDAEDVEISAWLGHYRSDAVGKALPDLIDKSEYNTKLSLQIPAELDETEGTLTLIIEFETDKGSKREEYTFNVQREPYSADILFVEVDSSAEIGSAVQVDIVIKNLGRHELDDLVVEASVPELGISKRAYFGDLYPTDDDEEWDEEDAEDAAEGKMYLKIPVNTNIGTYELVVKASNSDTSSEVRRVLTVTGAEEASRVLVPVASKEISMGEIKTYSLVIVNLGSTIGTYEVIPETAEGVLVNVGDPLVTVPAGASRVVEIDVKAGDRDGTYSFAVNVNSDNKLVERVVMNANVVKGALGGVKSNLTILTIILAIVFVVLLIVLIALLTRKPEKPEELEESYY